MLVYVNDGVSGRSLVKANVRATSDKIDVMATPARAGATVISIHSDATAQQVMMVNGRNCVTA